MRFLRTCARALGLIGMLAACPAGGGPDDGRFRVTLLTPGSIADGGWNQGAFEGLQRIERELETEEGGRLTATGRRLAVIPLRNRREERVTRICETLTEWRCEGRTGYGLSEYLDQVTPRGEAERG